MKGHDFWKSYVLTVVQPSFVIFFFFFFGILCLKDPLNSICIGVDLLHNCLGL